MAGRERLAVRETCPGQSFQGPKPQHNRPAKTVRTNTRPTSSTPAQVVGQAAKERPEDDNASEPWPRSAGDARAVHQRPCSSGAGWGPVLSLAVFGRRNPKPANCVWPGKAEFQEPLRGLRGA